MPQGRLRVDRHLAAILEPVVVVHDIWLWLRVIKSPFAMVVSVRGSGGIRGTRKRSVIRPMARFSRQRITEIGKLSVVVEISTQAQYALTGEDAEHLALVFGELLWG